MGRGIRCGSRGASHDVDLRLRGGAMDRHADRGDLRRAMRPRRRRTRDGGPRVPAYRGRVCARRHAGLPRRSRGDRLPGRMEARRGDEQTPGHLDRGPAPHRAPSVLRPRPRRRLGAAQEASTGPDSSGSAGARTIGVTWGYGTRARLEAAGVDYLIETPDALAPLFRALTPSTAA